MPFHPPIIDARYDQGRKAYTDGFSPRELTNLLNLFDAMHEQPDLSNEQHAEIAASGPSLILGYVEGVIDDIRIIASGRRGQKA